MQRHDDEDTLMRPEADAVDETVERPTDPAAWSSGEPGHDETREPDSEGPVDGLGYDGAETPDRPIDRAETGATSREDRLHRP